jgi:hypothetical protein
MTCKYCNRHVFSTYEPYITFDVCEYHWLGPEGNLYFTDFDILTESLKEWVKNHPGAVVCSADKFPMLGFVASVENDKEDEVYQCFIIHLKDIKRKHNNEAS